MWCFSRPTTFSLPETRTGLASSWHQAIFSKPYPAKKKTLKKISSQIQPTNIFFAISWKFFQLGRIGFKEILLEISLIEEMKTACYEVIKRCPKPYSTIPLTAKINLIRLTTYHWQHFVSNFCDIRKGWHCEISCRLLNITLLILYEIQELAMSCKISNSRLNYYRTSRSLFCKKFAMSYLEILHPFLILLKFKTQGYQYNAVKRIQSIFADKENSKTRLGAPL